MENIRTLTNFLIEQSKEPRKERERKMMPLMASTMLAQQFGSVCTDQNLCIAPYDEPRVFKSLLKV